MTQTPPGDSEQAFLDRAVVVALGSNLLGAYASSRELLDAALTALKGNGLIVVRASSWWRSKAWPEGSGPDFLNGVALVETGLAPDDALARLHEIERVFGRRRAELNAPRTLDLDLIAYGRRIEAVGPPVLPHPRAAERRFVMGPLAQIAAGWRHPVLGEFAKDLATKATVGADASDDS